MKFSSPAPNRGAIRALCAVLFLSATVFAARGESKPDAPAQPLAADVDENARLTTQPLVLCDAVVRSLEHNTDLAVSRFAPKIQKEQILGSKGAFDAILNAGVNHSRMTSQTTANPASLPAGSPAVAVSRESLADFSITKPWATGTQTGIEISTIKNVSSIGPDFYDSKVIFSIRQSLLRGMRPAVNLARIHEAQNNYKSSLYKLRADTINVVSRVETTYWNLALAYELLEVQKFSLDLAKRQLDRTQAFVDVGKVSPLELTSAKAELASRRQNFIDAKTNLQKTALDMLALIEPEIGENNRTVLPFPADQARLPTLAGADGESLELAMKNRPDLFQAYLDLENGKLEVIRTKDGVLPQLDLVGSYGLTGLGTNFQKSRDAVEDRDFDQYSVGLQFQVPIPNRTARGGFRAATQTRQQLDAAIKNLTLKVKTSVLQGRIDLANGLASVEAARATVALEEENLRNQEEKWKNGLATSLDVIQAQRDLVNSKDQLLIRIANALISEINLYVQEGTLLEVRGIQVDGGEELK